MQHAADDNHGMGSHDVDHLVATKLREMISANDHVFVPAPHIIHACLELNYVINVRLILDCPVHATTNATQRIFAARVAAGQLLEYRNHPIRIEAAIREVDVAVDAKLQLSILLRGSRVNACGTQTSKMILTLTRINHMNCLVATLKSISYEWKQDPILFVIVVEESADVTRLVELGTSERNGSRGLSHWVYPPDVERRPNQDTFNQSCTTPA